MYYINITWNVIQQEKLLFQSRDKKPDYSLQLDGGGENNLSFGRKELVLWNIKLLGYNDYNYVGRGEGQVCQSNNTIRAM